MSRFGKDVRQWRILQTFGGDRKVYLYKYSTKQFVGTW